MSFSVRCPRVFSAFIYSTTLACVYIFIIVPNFGYQGFVAENVGSRIPVFLIIASVFFMILPPDMHKPSAIFGCFYYALVFVPAALILALSNLELIQAGFVVFNISLPLLLVRFLTALPALSSGFVFFKGGGFFWLGVLVSILSSYIVLFKVFGVRSPSGLEDIYLVRLQAREVLADSTYGVGHILRLLSNVLNPLVLIFGLVARRYYLVVLAIVGQFIIFTFDATKSTLLSPLMIGMFLIIVTLGKNRAASVFLVSLSVLIIICVVLDGVFFDGWNLNYLFVRRFIVIPGQLTSVYFDFFMNADFFNWGGRFGLADNYPEYLSPGFLIGDVVYGNSDGNANANFLADAYANYGIVGVFLVLFVLGSVLWLFDSSALGEKKLMGCLLMVMPSFSLVNTGLWSVLFSHGLLLCLIAVWLLPKSKMIR